MITINLLGFDLEISWSSFILVLIITNMTSSFLKSNDPLYSQRKFVSIFITTIAVFFSLFVHELLHALFALLFEYEVTKAVVWALGAGVYIKTPLEDMQLMKSVLILVSGPLSNLLLAYIFREKSRESFLDSKHFQYRFLAIINLSLFHLNILPIFPLDGGKVVYVILLQLLSSDLALYASIAIAILVVTVSILFGSGQKYLIEKFMSNDV